MELVLWTVVTLLAAGGLWLSIYSKDELLRIIETEND